MAEPITFTLDLEDHRPDELAPLRYPEVTRGLLDRLAGWGVVGTFFVVGVVAEAEPDLVRAVAAAGHEIGLHGWRHTPLTELDPARLRAEATRGKALLEDLTGTEVVGFRAPTYSLTADSLWATDVLAEVGFAYSSSVLPTRNPLYGFPGVPEDPFRWPSGLAEFPVPIAGLGPVRAPYLGGTYLRIIPRSLIDRAHGQGGRRAAWTYLHPYDVDTGERFWVVPDAGWMSPLLWMGRRTVLDKVEQLVGDGAGPPLRDRLAEADLGGTFDPATIVDASSSTPGRTPTMTATDATTNDPTANAPTPDDGAPAGGEFNQAEMVHTLPPAPLVERIDFLVDQARGKRVIHVGFVDTGCRTMNEDAGAWLHRHLDVVATDLVGIDVDEAGVADAVAQGFAAHVADCRDPAAVAALGVEPAELVIAGEVIEHLDDPGAFLDGLHGLVAPGGRLIVTTPNAAGLFNVFASLGGKEINHPDHVVMFTWRTLTNLAARHGWEHVATRVYVPALKDVPGEGIGAKALALAGRTVVAIERGLARVGRGFTADGMIVVLRSTR